MSKEEVLSKNAKQIAIGFHHWRGLDEYFYDSRKNMYFPKKQDGLYEDQIDYISLEDLFDLYIESLKTPTFAAYKQQNPTE